MFSWGSQLQLVNARLPLTTDVQWRPEAQRKHDVCSFVSDGFGAFAVSPS